MENKKYLDKVIGSLVRGTKIYHDKDGIQFPFYPFSSYSLTINLPFPHPKFSSPTSPSYFFSKYCIDVYGLTDQEIGYVWVMYKSIIKDKITNK